MSFFPISVLPPLQNNAHLFIYPFIWLLYPIPPSLPQSIPLPFHPSIHPILETSNPFTHPIPSYSIHPSTCLSLPSLSSIHSSKQVCIFTSLYAFFIHSRFQWSSNGTIRGKQCVRWKGKNGRDGWYNNYLCADEFPEKTGVP